MTQDGRVALTLNGHSVETEEGRLVIDVAEEMGIFVPRFCYHPGMKSVAVCRMCLVKVDGQKKLLPACATPVSDGMKVSTVDPEAVDAQEGMLEFLLINHPLDCPICDRGGECPLQDQTYRHGPGSSRYVDPKRTFEKPLEISGLVVLDRERCVLCWRCVRFADEIAGDRFIQLVDRGPGTQILTFKDEPFDSYFSGNTIQICPVGALTAKTYRFVSRPWDLKTAPTVCAYCSVGCPMTNEARADKLVRCQALPNENVNDFWICDKGRFGHHYVDSEDRLATPLVRTGSEFEVASWGEALEAVVGRLRDGARVGVIAGGHLTTEDAYAVARLAKHVIGTRDVDSRVQDAGAAYEVALDGIGVAGSSASLNDVAGAKSIVWVGPDPKETLPVLYLRLRKAVVDNDAKLVVVSPRSTSLDALAERVVRCDAGAEARELERVSERSSEGPDRDGLEAPVVVCWGPSSPGRDERAILEAAVALAARVDARLLVCPPHAGSQGLLDMGVHPALDRGHERAQDAGRDTRAILEAAAEGELDALLVFGADLIADFPDAELAERALRSEVFVVVNELFPTETVAYADVVFPSAAYAERAGTFTNLERRLQKIEPLLSPPATATEPWRLCARIAAALGEDWRWTSHDDVWRDIRRDVRTHADVRLEDLTQESPPATLNYESPFEMLPASPSVAGPGALYPKGHRSGAPFQTGQSWPLSWELRQFEARQRPGYVPPVPAAAAGGSSPSGSPLRSATEASAEADASSASRPPATEPSSRGDDDVADRGEERTPPPSEFRSERSERGLSERTEAVRSETAGREFVLYTGRLLYDRGAMVSRSVALQGIAPKPYVEVNGDDADALGLRDGDDAIVEGNGTQARLRVAVSDIARGAVFVPYDQGGFRANRLIGGVDPVVTVRRP